MTSKKMGFVGFHRPGRWTFIFAGLIPIGIFFFAIVREPFMLIFTLVGAPLILLCIDVISKRKLLAITDNESELHTSLKVSGIKWLYGKKGKGSPQFDREAQHLPRTIADNSLFKQLKEIEIPDGLTEPEQLRGSIPSNAITSIIGGIVCILIMNGMWRLTRSTAPANMKLFAWFLIPLIGFCFFLLIFGLPVFQKNKLLPDFLRALGRGQLFKKGFVVGPGWIKCGSRVWSADTDVLLIRRSGWRSASAEIVCLLVSTTARKKIRFSGVNDQDFRTLFGFWNIAEVRMEFVDSELS